MRALRVLAMCGGLLTVRLAAQVSVEVTIDQPQYLPNEDLPVGVRVTNYSGQTLKLGEEQEWLELSVEADSGSFVAKLSDPPVVEPFEVPNASRGTRWVNLAPHFDMTRPGRYRVYAVVRIKELQLELGSPPAGVNIAGGARLYEQRFGVPVQQPDGSVVPEIRKYCLIQASRTKELRLYAQVTDEDEERVFRVFPLGPMLTFSEPEARIDRDGLFHVLFQIGSRNFSYSVIRPDGAQTVRRTYQYTSSRPELRAARDGEIKVIGGARLRTSSDLPKEEPKGPLEWKDPASDTGGPARMPALRREAPFGPTDG